uniref:Sushi domain-containing protein n=1 Tax=Meloidogyne hapla TaxID=6305 RepID=A0A1I8BGS2_MELHA
MSSLPSLLAPVSVKANIPSFPTTCMLQCPQSYLSTGSDSLLCQPNGCWSELRLFSI